MSGRAYFFNTSRLSRIRGSDVVVLSVGEDVDCEGSGAVWIAEEKSIKNSDTLKEKNPRHYFLPQMGMLAVASCCVLRASPQYRFLTPEALLWAWLQVELEAEGDKKVLKTGGDCFPSLRSHQRSQ